MADEGEALADALPSTNYGALPKSQDAQPCFGAVNGHGANSSLLTAGIIIADVVGAGILSMAVAISKFGWLLGTVVVLAMLAMNVHVSVLLWRVRIRCPGAFTYIQLSTAAFARASEGQRNLVVIMTGASQYIFLFSILGLYALTLGKALGMMMGDWHICLPVLTLLASALLLPVHMTARTMGKWKSLIWLNVATILGSIIIPLVEMAWRGMEATRLPDSEVHAVAPLTFAGVLSGLNVLSFAFTSQFMLVEIISEMEDPHDFPKAYVMSAPFQAAAFLICGLGGYFFVGDRVTGMIGDNIPFGLSFRLAAMCLFAHMIVTFLIKSIVFCRALHDVCDPDSINDESARGWSVWAMIVTAVLASSWFVSQSVPFFTTLVELLGASVTPVACYMIPIVLYLRWVKDFGGKEDQVSAAERALIAAEVVLSVVVLVAGTCVSVSEISQQWHTFGRPFECHCEHIWQTCLCSGSHPGMEYCQLESAFANSTGHAALLGH